MRLVAIGIGVAPWLGGGCQIVATHFEQFFFAMPPVPCLETTVVSFLGTITAPCLGTSISTVPCLEIFASALSGHVRPSLFGTLARRCLRRFAIAQPGHGCSPCLGRSQIPSLRTLASAFLGHVCGPWLLRLATSLPGNVCQYQWLTQHSSILWLRTNPLQKSIFFSFFFRFLSPSLVF